MKGTSWACFISAVIIGCLGGGNYAAEGWNSWSWVWVAAVLGLVAVGVVTAGQAKTRRLHPVSRRPRQPASPGSPRPPRQPHRQPHRQGG